MDQTTLLISGMAAVIGLLVGAWLTAWWWRKKTEKPLDFPAKLPLDARGLVTTDEHEVWTWLRQTFHDHVVMVKLPVSRFTHPRESDKQKSRQWLELLSGVHATFTVCTTDGKVVGCVDVPGKRGLSTVNRELKEDLLSDCGIAYTVVRGSRLPTGHAMRAAFLGEILAEPIEDVPYADTLIGDSGFHAELDAFTKQKMQAHKEAALKALNKEAQSALQPVPNRNVGFNPEGTGPIKVTNKPGRRGEATWEDSFIHPSDSRPAKYE